MNGRSMRAAMVDPCYDSAIPIAKSARLTAVKEPVHAEPEPSMYHALSFVLSLAIRVMLQSPFPEIALPKSPSITPEELRDLVYALAGPEAGGRLSGADSGRAAGDFIAKQLEARGVSPGGVGGGYFQPFGEGGEGSKFRNIIGIVRGADPKLNNEFVVVGAHYDHCGDGDPGAGAMGNKGEIHHGADDNGSGTATVLALARVVAMKPLPRSTVFILFDAEERGLFGSAHFCKSPTVGLNKINMMINIDMVGRSYDGYLFVGGIGTAGPLDDMLTKALRNETKLLKNVERNTDDEARSDQHNFVLKSIPSLFWFTGIHRDYHQPRDTPEKIQYKPMAAIARAIFEYIKLASATKEKLQFTSTGNNGMPKGDAAVETAVVQRARVMARRLGGQIAPGAGGKPVFQDTEAAGARAGFQRGDVILAIAKDTNKNSKAFIEVKTVEALRLELEKMKAGDPVQLKIQRGDASMVIGTTIANIPEWKKGPDKDDGDLPKPKAPAPPTPPKKFQF